VTLSNNNAIETRVLALIDKIALAQEKKYSGNQLRTSVQMTESIKNLQQEALDSFKENSKYAHESSSYKAWKLQFDNEIKKVVDKLVTANHDKVKAFFEQEAETSLASLRKLYRTVPIPLEDEELEGLIKSHSEGVKRELEKRVKDYQSSSPDIYRQVMSDFNNQVQQWSEKLRKENVQELLHLSKHAIERSEHRLQEIYSTAHIQWLFEREARSILTDHLRGNIKSDKLLHSAVQAYIEDTLPHKFPFSSTMSYIKLIGFAVLGGIGYLFFSTFVKGPNIPSHHITARIKKQQ